MTNTFFKLNYSPILNLMAATHRNNVGTGWNALQWCESYLFHTSHTKLCFSHSKFNYDVPQGSVVGPFWFTLYMLLWGSIFRRCSIYFHCKEDDTQLYLWVRPNNTQTQRNPCSLTKDIKIWMTSNLVLLNSDKTDIFVLGPVKPLKHGV